MSRDDKLDIALLLLATASIIGAVWAGVRAR